MVDHPALLVEVAGNRRGARRRRGGHDGLQGVEAGRVVLQLALEGGVNLADAAGAAIGIVEDATVGGGRLRQQGGGVLRRVVLPGAEEPAGTAGAEEMPEIEVGLARLDAEIARQGDRQSVVEGKGVSVRVDLGGRRIIKKKKNNLPQTTRQN